MHCRFKTHQEQGRSYKEVCAPVIERLRFLFNELRPAVCNDLSIMSKLKSLSSLPRWRRVVQKIIRERRKKRGKCFEIQFLVEGQETIMHFVSLLVR